MAVLSDEGVVNPIPMDHKAQAGYLDIYGGNNLRNENVVSALDDGPVIKTLGLK